MDSKPLPPRQKVEEPQKVSGPQFELLADHYLPGDVFALAGTVIGDGTGFPLTLWDHPDEKKREKFSFRPSQDMRPMNPAAECMFEDTDFGDGSVPENNLPMTTGTTSSPAPKEPNKNSAPKDS